MTRLLAGNAGGGGSVGGAANIAAAWCWCCAWDLSARCEVDRWGPGPCGDSVTCFARPRGVPLTVLLHLLKDTGLSVIHSLRPCMSPSHTPFPRPMVPPLALRWAGSHSPTPGNGLAHSPPEAVQVQAVGHHLARARAHEGAQGQRHVCRE